MSTSSSEQTPIYIAKWRLRPRERGRKHMAVFIPNPKHKAIDPSDTSQECLGTLLQVQGSPLAGFTHNIKRNWHRQKTPDVESVQLLVRVDAPCVPEPKTMEYLDEDTTPNGTLDQIALSVRPPGVSQPLWDPNVIFDCQDWVYDFFVRLSQRRIVRTAVLDTLRTLQDEKTALMPKPGSSMTPVQPITASVAGVAEPRASRGVYSNPEWDGERGAFRRYDHTSQRWEYRDQAGVWRPVD
ncbi:hypothetical protein PRZ48_003666 [Zasmidium cellare]|uniref:Uncharacterized protein n=1 Tax=Zasmidium cellare TaxID=395010 RepID=A0ABR0EX88_ZASCE|nr:hypothetical protein PRZ48_003666 [Zasmidium cellare]